jgi:peptide deformylase
MISRSMMITLYEWLNHAARPAPRAQALSLDGEEIELHATGLAARLLQHEVDHLDGVLFFDRMSAAERETLGLPLESEC